MVTVTSGAYVLGDFNTLLRISTLLNSLHDIEGIQRQVLLAVLEVVPAERAAVVLLDEVSRQEFSSVLAMDRSGSESCDLEIDGSIAERVASECVAVLSNDVASRPKTPSPGRPRVVRSVMALPMELFGRVLGLLYLDGIDLAARFDALQLQFLRAIGSISAVAIDNSRRMEALATENLRLQAEIDVEHNMVGDSPAMRSVYQFIGKVAGTDATVLVLGESGTGKELVARAIHSNSPRSKKPFVAINCAAITDTLLESELFGHEKGAFTGAVAQKKGKLESGEGGTVFLDEIGELAPGMQAKLLRVLQEREFERVGGTRSIPLNVRLVAATNRNLEAASRQGRFRQDLYYRLNVVSIFMPPLREHREDIPQLANYFALKYGEKSKRTITGLSAAARACLQSYDWPGNIRELENAIERAVVLGSTALILPEDLPEAVLEKRVASGMGVTRYHDGVVEAKKQMILRALEQARGVYTDAARLLGLHPNYLHRLMRNMNLKGEGVDEGIKNS